MKMTLVPPLTDVLPKINHQSGVFFIGSCFSQVLGLTWQEYKGKALYNPFGTVYNPISIQKMLEVLYHKSVPSIDSISEHNGIFYHLDYHSDMSALSKDEVLENIQKATTKAADFLFDAAYIFITLGTAFVYEEKSTNHIVANCHKLPAHHFLKRMLSTEEIHNSLQQILELIAKQSPKTKVVWTVSPVRHIKDGLIENNWSKARLIDAIHSVISGQKDTHYFPAYEIVMDQMRDYRYYEHDLIHPGPEAREMVWQYFVDTYFDEETKKLLPEIQKILSAYRHRPRFAEHPDYVRFCEQQIAAIKTILNKWPELNFEEEVNHFSQF